MVAISISDMRDLNCLCRCDSYSQGKDSAKKYVKIHILQIFQIILATYDRSSSYFIIEKVYHKSSAKTTYFLVEPLPGSAKRCGVW